MSSSASNPTTGSGWPCFSSRWFRISEPTRTKRGRRKPWQAPPLPGVYALYLRGRLIYIGCAVNIRARLSAHAASRRWVDGLSIKAAITLSGAERRERRLIERLKPSDNREWNQAHPLRGQRNSCPSWSYWAKFGSQ